VLRGRIEATEWVPRGHHTDMQPPIRTIQETAVDDVCKAHAPGSGLGHEALQSERGSGALDPKSRAEARLVPGRARCRRGDQHHHQMMIGGRKFKGRRPEEGGP
jgi:hypothetical protein